ncbi:MAG: hypothetical protein IAG13_05150, partial [Deltaproteobacteria bacterium]|nr:hypothetical protein [Nannocystaceae bacterium]
MRALALLGVGLAAGLLAAPASASAFEDAGLTPESVAVLKSATDVLFDRGTAAYRQQAYARAAEMWERSYDLLGELADVEARRDEVALHLAHAHLQANAVDHDPRRLLRARELLSGFTDVLARTSTPSELADRERAAQMLEIIGYRLDQSEAPTLAAEVPAQPQVSPRRPADLRRANGLIAGGATGLALGVIALGVSADLARRMEIDHADPLTET